jgi:hypothetical protein
MFARFMPTEGRFFELFNLHANEIVEGAKELLALMAITTRAKRSTSCTKRSSRRLIAKQFIS